MSKLLILGAGQYGFVAREIAEAMGCFTQIDFLDDKNEIAIGRISDVELLLQRREYDTAFVAIGNSAVRAEWLTRIAHPATLIHPRAVVSPSAGIDDGCLVEAGAVICTDAKIGRGTIVMANAVVGHNATVGECCQLKYNCSVPENCIVPNRIKVDCNVVYCDQAMIAAKNRQFVDAETKKTGISPSYF